MYFHYTSRSGAKAIDQSGYIQPSEESGSFGPGVYLTDLDPKGFFRDEILKNNYGGIRSNFENRADWVIEVLEKNLNMQLLRKVHVPGRRRIFVYPYSISVSSDQIYDKPRCLKDCEEVSTTSSDEEYYQDSDDDVSDEFDEDCEIDVSEGTDEENEESVDLQIDGTGFYLSEDEENEYQGSHCTSAEEESSCHSDNKEENTNGGSGEDYDTDGHDASDDYELDSNNGCCDEYSDCCLDSEDDSY